MSNEMSAIEKILSAIEKIQEGLSMLTAILPGCNPLAPGFLKEVVLANILGHKVETAKHLADAWDMDGNAMEYICVMENVRNPETGKMKY